MRRTFPGRPAVLASKEGLSLEDEHISIPASMLLWALRYGADLTARQIGALLGQRTSFGPRGPTA